MTRQFFSFLTLLIVICLFGTPAFTEENACNGPHADCVTIGAQCEEMCSNIHEPIHEPTVEFDSAINEMILTRIKEIKKACLSACGAKKVQCDTENRELANNCGDSPVIKDWGLLTQNKECEGIVKELDENKFKYCDVKQARCSIECNKKDCSKSCSRIGQACKNRFDLAAKKQCEYTLGKIKEKPDEPRIVATACGTLNGGVMHDECYATCDSKPKKGFWNCHTCSIQCAGKIEQTEVVQTPGHEEVGPGTAVVMCPMDAKICADGTIVGRTGPNCEFSACPDNARHPAGANPAFFGESGGVE